MEFQGLAPPSPGSRAETHRPVVTREGEPLRRAKIHRGVERTSYFSVGSKIRRTANASRSLREITDPRDPTTWWRRGCLRTAQHTRSPNLGS